jgi:fatty-acyl-CoA synthase
VPDARYGEELCACIILRPRMQSSAEEIRKFRRGQIAHYKVPRYVTFVDSFSMTVTGKMRKFLLRQQMAA